VLVVVCLASAVGVALAQCQPTGLKLTDALFSAALGAAMAAAGSRASSTALLLAAGAAAVGIGGDVLLIAAGAGALLALAIGWGPRQPAVLGALSAGCTVQALVRLPHLGFSGGSALLAGVAVTIVLVSGVRRSSAIARRRVKQGAIAFGAIALVGMAGAGLAAIDARRSSADAVAASRQAFTAARAGNDEAALTAFRAAALAFEDAKSAVNAPWAMPGWALPVVGSQLRAVEEVAAHGSDLAVVAAQATLDADLDSIRFVNGRMDLDAVSNLEVPLLDVATELDDAQEDLADVDSPWLLPPVADRVAAFTDEVDDALPQARLALDGVRLAPQLLGADGQRRYFLAFVTPSELRGLGGFMGEFGILTANDGDQELSRHGSIQRLTLDGRERGATITGPADYLGRWGTYEPAKYPGDITFSPDFPTVADVIGEYYPQTGGQPVDGVISVDPVALQSLLRITGPIAVPDAPEPLTADNAADFLLRDQYLEFGDRAQRKDFLDDATRLTFERLTSGDIPAPSRLANVLGPVVHEGRLMVSLADEDEQSLVDQVPDLAGEFPRPDGRDFVALTTQNGANNKIDIFMHRQVDYDATYDPSTGEVDATVTVTIRNDAPASGLPDIVLGNGLRGQPRQLPLGTNEVNLSLYTPHTLEHAELDGEPFSLTPGTELGWHTYTQFVPIPAGQEKTLTFELHGTIDPDADYHLTVANQPVVNPDEVNVTLHPADGWAVDAGGDAEAVDDGVQVQVDTTNGDWRDVFHLR
jgi:hypothetical protein